MIRQAISCDICGTEKKQTNHWFVASEHAGELRVSGWNARVRLRTGTKHLCGQTCLHKLMDEFMARTIAGRNQGPAVEATSPVDTRTDASLTSRSAYVEPRPCPAAIPGPTPVPLPASLVAAAPAVLPMPPKTVVDEPLILSPAARIDDASSYASRRWRAEAWERERALYAVERRNDSGSRHRSL